MGYRTPHIDHIAGEGARCTDDDGEQSCTAGRATLITGQDPYRAGRRGRQHRSRPTAVRDTSQGQGGTRLCADISCLRYRPAARRPQSIDTGMSHIGVRLAWPASGAR